MNGTILINSKSPFKYQGLSFQIKQGIKDIDDYQRAKSPFFDWNVRWAQKVSEKFAFKLNGIVSVTSILSVNTGIVFSSPSEKFPALASTR